MEPRGALRLASCRNIDERGLRLSGSRIVELGQAYFESEQMSECDALAEALRLAQDGGIAVPSASRYMGSWRWAGRLQDVETAWLAPGAAAAVREAYLASAVGWRELGREAWLELAGPWLSFTGRLA